MTSTTLQDTNSGHEPSPLDLLAALVRDPELREQWLAGKPPDIRALFDKAFVLVGVFAFEARWDVSDVLDEMGCHKRTGAQLDALTKQKLASCVGLFEWLARLLDRVPASYRVTRSLISFASGLYHDSRSDLDACERAMEEPLSHDDPMTATALLELGEIGLVFQAAGRALPHPVAAKGGAVDSNRFALAHVSSSTLDAWLTVDVEHLASEDGRLALEQRVRLDQHIPHCPQCLRAARLRGEATGVRTPPPSALSAPLELLH